MTVRGEIDLLTVDRFREVVADALDWAAHSETTVMLVLDLTEVTFLGSAGLTALVEATRAARRRREPLRIVVDHARPVIHPIELAGLGDVLALHHTLDHAMHIPT